MSKRVALSAALVVLVCAAPVWAFDIEKFGTPDVDKPGVPPQPAAGDLSCWLAAASNLLGGGGWGTGATAQQRAEGIYATLLPEAYNPPWPPSGAGGWLENALNYWLCTYGLNPDSPEYRPAASHRYTDVTVVDRWPYGLGEPDYTAMLAELDRCQYAAVVFARPAHALTLVGGDYDGVPSVWHDSDRDLAGQDQQLYRTVFDTSGFDLEPVAPTSDDPLAYNLRDAWAYVLLCPGLRKPDHAVHTYDVAYYPVPDPGQPGDFDPAIHVRGTNADAFAQPQWTSDTVFRVYNREVPDQFKELWLLIDYIDRVPDRADQETILLNYYSAATGLVEHVPPTAVTDSEDGGQLLLHWSLPCQPAWEEIVFPDARYSMLWDMLEHDNINVKDWNLAVWCTPEPATALLLAAGLLALARRRRRSR